MMKKVKMDDGVAIYYHQSWMLYSCTDVLGRYRMWANEVLFAAL